MSDTTRRRRTAVAAAATAAVGTAAPAAFPSPAAAVPQGCWANTICEYAHAGFGFPVHWWNANGSDETYGNNVYTSNQAVLLDNSISSVWNNTGRWVKLCNYPGCASDTEYGLCMAPGTAAVNLNAGTGYWNDRISAHRTYAGNPPRCAAGSPNQYGCSV